MCDEQGLVSVALFNPINIEKNSLKFSVCFPARNLQTASQWSISQKRHGKRQKKPSACLIAPVITPARVRLFGCAEKAQAIREGKYMVAAKRYRRCLVSFQTEFKGLIATYGDLIAIANDMPGLGQGAEV